MTVASTKLLMMASRMIGLASRLAKKASEKRPCGKERFLEHVSQRIEQEGGKDGCDDRQHD